MGSTPECVHDGIGRGAAPRGETLAALENMRLAVSCVVVVPERGRDGGAPGWARPVEEHAPVGKGGGREGRWPSRVTETGERRGMRTRACCQLAHLLSSSCVR